MSRKNSVGKFSRELRAIEQFACPTCKARPGQVCVDRDGIPMRSTHGPSCHKLRRQLLTDGKINIPDQA